MYYLSLAIGSIIGVLLYVAISVLIRNFVMPVIILWYWRYCTEYGRGVNTLEKYVAKWGDEWNDWAHIWPVLVFPLFAILVGFLWHNVKMLYSNWQGFANQLDLVERWKQRVYGREWNSDGKD